MKNHFLGIVAFTLVLTGLRGGITALGHAA